MEDKRILKAVRYRDGKRSTTFQSINGVTFLTYDLLSLAGLKHGMSTRLGGVSEGYLGSMNVSFSRGDLYENVRENLRRFSEAVGFDSEKIVFSDQVHKTHIHRAELSDAGKVACRDTDGLITNVRGLPLFTFYADCVPLLFFDPVHQAIGMAHSGWKGTVGKIGSVMIGRLKEEYGSRPQDLLIAIGPSICQSCYEVDEPLLREFLAAFGEEARKWFRPSKEPDHYLLDLAEACRYTLISSGAVEENIAMPDLCTCCNPKLLFSHRASGGKRGNLGVVMVLS